MIRHRGQWALSALEGIELAEGDDRAAAVFRIRLDELLRAGVRAGYMAGVLGVGVGEKGMAAVPPESRMTLIAINVPLDPDAATVERAQAANARLREELSRTVSPSMPATRRTSPFSSLQRFVRTADLDEVANAVAEVLRTEQSLKWECNATGCYDLAYRNLGLVGIVIEPTQDLRRLQHLWTL